MPASSVLPTGSLVGAGIASGLSHRLQYIARFTNNGFGPNGNSWLVTTVPYMSFGTVMVDDMSREVFMVESQRGTTRWLWDSGTSQYAGEYGTKRRLSVTADGYLVTQPSGASWLFFGPDSLAGLKGKLKQMTAEDGTQTIATYDGSQRLVSLVRSLPGTQHSASLHYTSATSGPHEGRYLLVEKRISRDGVMQPVKRWNYTYHTGADSAGNLNDLKTTAEEVFNAQTSQWESIYTTYYRYYTEDSAEGFKHGLRYTLNPQDYALMVSAGYPPEDVSISPDSLLATFATSFRQYDAQKRVTLWQALGGTLTTTFDRLNSDGTGQNWSRRSIKTTPDGSVQTVYYNQANQPILKILAGGGVTTMEYSEYDDQYHPVLRCGSDAIASVTQPSNSGENLTVTLHTDQGLLKRWEYYPMSGGGAGAAPGYVKWEGVQQGSGGTIIKIYELTYSAYVVDDDTLYRTASRTEYRSDASGGSNPATTSYDYEWRTDSVRPLQKTTTLPVISTDEHGTGDTYTQVERYDRFGNPEWLKDEIGVMLFQVFDPITGGLWQRITDVDTQRMDPGVVPEGWTTPVGGGYHLISDFECDTQGRNLQELGPLHSCDMDGTVKLVRSAVFRVYLDKRRQTWVSQGYAVGDGYRTLGPVTITQRDLRNQITDVIQSSNPGGDKIDGGDRFPQSNWTKWTRSLYSKQSLLLATCAYHTIPSSDREVDQNPVLGFKDEHYLETGYGYDVQDRRNKTVSPGGTITREVLDARSLVTERWVGTNDVGATDSNPVGSGPSSGNNMVKVLASTYNDGQVDNPGSLIEERRPFNDTSADDQVITYGYDFRGRRVLSTTSDGIRVLIKATAYDNQNKPVSITSYHTAVDDANRTAYQTTALDPLERPYLQQIYGVNQSTGALTYPLKTNSWYDPRGLLIKTVKPGFNGYTKTQFDTLRRPTASYLAYPPAGGLDGNSNNVADDIVIEQKENSYDNASNLLLTTARQRFHDATGTGPLNEPSGLQPLARVTYDAQWADPIGRQHVQANYGTNGGAELTRPALAPAPSDTILVSRTDYAQDGLPAQTVATDGVVTRTQKDRLGRQIKRVENFVADAPETDNGANRTTEFVYAPDGGLSRLIVKNIVTGDQVTCWDFGTTLEDSGVARTDLLRAKMYPGDMAPDGTVLRSLSYRYDRQGRNVGTTDANSTEHVFDLDKLGRILENRVVTLGTSVDGAVRRISRAYDARGLVASITSHDNPTVGSGSVVNQVFNEYNAFGQLSTDIQSHSGAADGSTPRVSYTYANGSANTTRRTSVTYPSGKVINISYGGAGSMDDRLDRMAQTQIAEETDLLATFQWAGAGRFLRLGMPQPHLELTYHKPADEPVGDSGDPYSGYDRFGRTVDMRWNKLDGDSATSLDRVQYGYDRASRRLWRQDLIAPTVAKQDKFFQYDGLGQVTQSSQGNLNINRTAIAAIPTETETFAYDPMGNWQNHQRDEDGFPVLEQPRQNNQDNQILSLSGIAAGISHDANGNMTATHPDKSGDWSKGYLMIWDAWNRLVQVNDAQTAGEVARYAFDGSTRRIQSTIFDLPSPPLSSHYFYNDVWKCVEERLDASTTPERLYFWGMRPGHRDELLRRDSGGISLYCLMDYYDPIAITDGDGTVEERYCFSAFGLVQFLQYDFTPRANSLFGWNFLFHGQFQDIETSWYNYGFRFYEPEIGRWLSRDPIFEEGGFNLYSIALNDTINNVDYLGLHCYDCKAFFNACMDANDSAFEKTLQAILNKYKAARKAATDEADTKTQEKCSGITESVAAYELCVRTWGAYYGAIAEAKITAAAAEAYQEKSVANEWYKENAMKCFQALIDCLATYGKDENGCPCPQKK
ncbi:MAG: hypothetical protein JNM65_02865 [Verrucomicrobiaceae bacterium]|nr:hypothetical protein [Verrucomicrobiaceae bacterium]